MKSPKQTWLNALIYAIRFCEQETGEEFIGLVEDLIEELYYQADKELNDINLIRGIRERFEHQDLS